MNFLTFKEQLKNYTVFSLSDIRKLDDRFDLRRLSEWQAKGYLQQIRRGYYTFAGLEISESVLYLMANKIYAPSYVSLEMALAHYHLIPEAVYGITSVAARKTKRFETAYGDFIYRHIKPPLMFGYQLIDYRGQSFRIAEVEKALLDYFYLNVHLTAREDFDELRFHDEEFKRQADKVKLQRYLLAFGNKSLSGRVRKFLRHINYD